MDIHTLIRNRRTIHDYDPDKPVADDIIKQAIETACWAPNHHLTEPWHFFLLGQETRESICELNRDIVTVGKGVEVAEKKYKRWKKIPGWLVVSCDKSNDQLRFMEDYAACACAIQNMMLSLWDKGIGMKWSTGAVTRDERFYELVWIDPEQEHVMGILWYGYPAEVPQTVRKPVTQIMTELP